MICILNNLNNLNLIFYFRIQRKFGIGKNFTQLNRITAQGTCPQL